MSKKYVKWSKKIENLILDEMATGKHPAQIFRENKDVLPNITTFNRRQIKDLEFKEKVDAAYTVIYQCRMAEMDELTSKLASELKPGHDFKEVEAWRRSRLDVLKFDLGKMSPMMSKRFDKASKVEIEGNTNQTYQFVIQDYSSKDRVIDVDTDKDG